MRVVKEHEERKTELVETAERLFYLRGYENCTVKDIVNELKLAKGTFFYYFPTKEDILNEIIARRSEQIRQECERVAAAKELSREYRFVATILHVNQVVTVEGISGPIILHNAGNALLHQKIMSAIITVLAPILTEIVEENDQDTITSDYESAQDNVMIILAAISLLLDDGYFEWSEIRKQQLIMSMIDAIEKLLGLNKERLIKAFSDICGEKQE